MRTALALALAGVALEALDAPIFASMRLAAALIFVSLGLLAAVHSWWAWAATEKSLRVGRPLPGMAVGALVAVGASVACVLVIVGSLIP